MTDVLSRNTDPASSHEAEATIRKTGKLGANRLTALQLLVESEANGSDKGQGSTTWELAKGHLYMHEKIRRRLNDLAQFGYAECVGIRECTATHQLMQAWRVTAEGRRVYGVSEVAA